MNDQKSRMNTPSNGTVSIANVGGRTKQSFQFVGDPSSLMRQFTKTGDQNLLIRTNNVAMHGDFSAVPDFFTALLQVQQLEEEFLGYPSEIRNHVDNDASKLIELLADPERVDEAIALGLVQPGETEPIDIPTPPKPEVDPPQDPPPDQ